MSKENQIEEMTDIILIARRQSAYSEEIAEAVYNAGYRKRSENTIELPCKVGQTVYMPWEWKDTSGIAILTVEKISITEAGQSIRTDLWSDDEDYWLAYNCGVFYFDDIGKTVFLTKEEAEAKMKGGAE